MIGLKIIPSEAIAYFSRGSIYKNRGDINFAIADYTKAIELDPNVSIFYTNREAVYYDLKKIELAKDDYAKAIKIDHNNGLSYYCEGFFILKGMITRMH